MAAATVAAVWQESMVCPRRHLQDEFTHAKTAHGSHHCRHHNNDDESHRHCGHKERLACANNSCKGCQQRASSSCPVCLVMMSMMLLLSPPAAAAAAECGAHGAALAGGDACLCQPGYASDASGMCNPAPDSPGNWLLRFADGTETPEEHMWELMGKSRDSPLDSDEAVGLMDMMRSPPPFPTFHFFRTLVHNPCDRPVRRRLCLPTFIFNSRLFNSRVTLSRPPRGRELPC